MPRSTAPSFRSPPLAYLPSVLAVTLGCGTGDDAPTTGTETDTATTTGFTSFSTAEPTTTGQASTSGPASSTTTEETTGGSTGGDPVPSLDCPTPVDPAGGYDALAAQSFDEVLRGDPMTMELPEVCEGLGGAPWPEGQLDVHLPGDGASPASGRFPVFVFHKGNPLDFDGYTYLIEALQRLGFVVLNVEAEGTFGAESATNAMRCAVRWFYFESELFEDHGDCRLVVSGHSRGALSAHNLLQPLTSPEIEPYLAQLDVAAEVVLAPRRLDAVTYDESAAVPFLGLGTATDEDVRGQVVSVFERMVPEDQLSIPNPQPTPFKGLVWVYDLPHQGFGGASSSLNVSDEMMTRSGLDSSDYADKGHAITLAYVERFLRWQMFGEDSLRPYFLGEAYPPEVLDPDWWDYLDAYTQRSDPTTCQTLGINDCADSGCAWDGSTCQGLPVILHSFEPDTSNAGTVRRIGELFESPQDAEVESDPDITVDVDTVPNLIFAVSGLGTGHEGGGARFTVGNGGADWTATVRTAATDARDMAHASMRLGIPGPINGNLCEAVYDDSVELALTVSDGINHSSEVSLQPFVQQDAVWLQGAGTMPTPICAPQLFMATQRVAMADLCDDGFIDTENLESWSFTFPSSTAIIDDVVVDTLEFTNSPDDEVAVGTCATQSALWACEASTSLLPQRTVCTGEPTNGTCAGGDIAYEAIDVPEVPSSWGGPYDGWVVHMPPGFSDDPWNPTTELDDAMRQRCVLACEREWMSDPNVSVDCSSGGAFVDVSLLSTPSVGPIRRIAPSRRDGSGFFDDPLSSNLLDDACLAFDENLCPSAPFRTTPAEYPLEQATEYVFDVDTSESALSVDANGTQDSVSLYGTVGFSTCADGNANAPCPFALTSLEVKSIGSITVPVTCPDQSVINRTLYNLDVHLGQPAFGIAEEGTDQVGFPVGGIVLDASFKQNANTIELRGPTEIDLLITASPSEFKALEIPVHGELPACWGQEGIPAIGTFDLVLDVAAGPVDAPPSISIDIPALVTCDSSPVTLAATASDPDGDLDHVRWYVDDVPIALATSAIPFTTDHEIRAVAYDDRGAATTATKHIGCN